MSVRNPQEEVPDCSCPTCGGAEETLTLCPKCGYDTICPKCNYCTYDKCNNIEWVTFTRRTNDPKLGYIEQELTRLGILHRRYGESFHAPILQVPSPSLDAAWGILETSIKGTLLDELPDDNEFFLKPHG